MASYDAHLFNTFSSEFNYSTIASSSTTDIEPLQQWLIQFKRSLYDREKEYLNKIIYPYILGDYIPHNTYHLVAPSSIAKKLSPFHNSINFTDG